MAVNLSPVGGAAQQFFTNSGVPLAGGLLFTYAAGTSTPQTSYTSSIGNIAHTNPIILNSAGRVPGGEIWITNDISYKFVLKDSNNVLIATYDNIDGINSINAFEISYTPPFNNSVTTTVGNKLAQTVSVMDFGATGNGITDDTAAIQFALNSGSNAIFFPNGTYVITSSIYPKANQQLIGVGATITTTNNQFFYAIDLNNADNVEINGLKIIGPASGNGFDTAIIVNSSNNVLITGCLIKDIGQEATPFPAERGFGIHIRENSTNIKIVNNTIDNIKGYGLSRGDGILLQDCNNILIQGNSIGVVRRMQIAAADNVVDLRIIGNQLENSYCAAIDIEPDVVSTTTGKIIIQGNTIRNFGSKPGATIGSQFYGIDIHGVSSTNTNYVISDNIIIAENAQAVACIWAHSLANNATITGNILDCNGYCDGMLLYSGNGFKQAIISNNIIRNFVQYGINAEVNSILIVSDNIIESIAVGQIAVSIGGTVASPTYLTFTGNTCSIFATASGSGVYIGSVSTINFSDNFISVNSGDGLLMLQNEATMVAGVFSNNIMRNIGTGTAKSAFILSSVGAGAVTKTIFGGNVQEGFDTTLSTSGSVSFSAPIMMGGFQMNTTNVLWLTGAGTPESSITANIGSLYTRTNGGANTTLYVKESGTGNTGWIAK